MGANKLQRLGPIIIFAPQPPVSFVDQLIEVVVNALQLASIVAGLLVLQHINQLVNALQGGTAVGLRELIAELLLPQVANHRRQRGTLGRYA